MKNLFAVVVFALLALCGCSAQTSYISGVANGVTPYQNIYAMTPIPYGWVRVCTLPVTSPYGSPCTPTAAITDQYGNPLSIIGGNFGQLKTDVVGGYTFGCNIGNLEVQIAATNSNTPQKQFNITCPTVFNPLSPGTLYQAGPTGSLGAEGAPTLAYSYTLPANSLTSTGGIEVECTIQNTSSTYPATVAICFDGAVDCLSRTSGDYTVAINTTIDERATVFDNNSSVAQWAKAVAFDPAINNTVYSNTSLALNMSTTHMINCYVTQAGDAVTPSGFIVQRLAF